ncbi:MAG: ATP-binding cassette domain-containing protein, partial [Oscillospiraceae bacterium]|nr:ATP-binding cassette domain-containing protein [Oscillospiraceae bacterium]
EATRIGFVRQLPDEQIVTDKVWHELAFGLESLGFDTPTIRRRVAEMSSFFGIEEWFHRPTDSLSGGQKQILCLASVMAMQPEVLLLDEPTAQLDPIAASEFLSTLGRLNRELGVTVVLSEHRLEEAFALASQVAVLEGGKLVCSGTPQQVGLLLRDTGLFPACPRRRASGRQSAASRRALSRCATDGAGWKLTPPKSRSGIFPPRRSAGLEKRRSPCRGRISAMKKTRPTCCRTFR